MKKILGIIVLCLLFSGNAYANNGSGKSIWDYLEVGMSKKNFKKKVDGGILLGEGTFYGIADNYRRTEEMQKLDDGSGGWCCDRVFVGPSEKIYFKENQIEILTHRGKRLSEGLYVDYSEITPEIYYIFENVTEPTYCLIKKNYNQRCKGTIGNGILKAVVYNRYDALIIADPANTKSYEAKKIESKKRVVEKKEKEKKDAEKVKKVALEKTVEAKQSELAPMINSAKSTCKTLGFEEGTDKFTDCALKLYTQEVENKVAIEVAKQQASGSSSSGSMTIYDPVRDRQNQIDRGMKMLGGGCTLGIDC